MTSSALAIGAAVGPYRIVGELGQGGMGVVYRAVHTLLDRPAAIKVLLPELGVVSIASDRFLTEARATTSVRHPGIVEVYDYGYTDAGAAFIAMELLDGFTLHARLVERGTLPVAEALAIARRIAAPLQAAHERGVIHRDLKPDNVFLIRDPEDGSTERVKILDFGIAKLDTPTANRTTAGLVLGTPAYMSPEQCRGVKCDHRTDLYSLGCIIYQMIVGEPPYGRTATGTDMLVAHVSAPVPDIARFATVPSDVVRLVTRLLAKQPDERPRNAAEVVFEIDRYLAARRPTPRASSRRSLRVAVAASMGLAVSFAGAGIWYRFGHTRAPATELATVHSSPVALPTPSPRPSPVVTPLPTPPAQQALQPPPFDAPSPPLPPQRVPPRRPPVRPVDIPVSD